MQLSLNPLPLAVPREQIWLTLFVFISSHCQRILALTSPAFLRSGYVYRCLHSWPSWNELGGKCFLFLFWLTFKEVSALGELTWLHFQLQWLTLLGNTDGQCLESGGVWKIWWRRCGCGQWEAFWWAWWFWEKSLRGWNILPHISGYFLSLFYIHWELCIAHQRARELKNSPDTDLSREIFQCRFFKCIGCNKACISFLFQMKSASFWFI